MTLAGDSAEAQLLQELEAIERKISELEADKRSIQRLLRGVREAKVRQTDVTRKNSFTRIIIEKRVLDLLTDAKKPLKTYYLFDEAKLVVHNLRDNTFRTYLHRMKARGLVVSLRRGAWGLPTDVQR